MKFYSSTPQPTTALRCEVDISSSTMRGRSNGPGDKAESSLQLTSNPPVERSAAPKGGDMIFVGILIGIGCTLLLFALLRINPEDDYLSVRWVPEERDMDANQ